MDIVTFKTAKRLKEAGFPQPAPAFGQFWFDEKGALFFVVDAFDEIPIPLDGAWLIEKGGDVIHVERVVFGSSLAYAPSATDILRKLPGRSIGRYNTSKSVWDSPETRCQTPAEEANAANFDFSSGAKWAAEQMQAENEKLRAALEAIIDRYDVANMLAGDDPIIEQARKVLK